MLRSLLGLGEKALESVNGITLSGGDIITFGDVVKDYSPIHRVAEEAKRFGFVDTPVIGVHLAALGGRISRDLLTAMQSPEKPLYFTAQEVTFRDPVYPNEPINWQIREEEREEDSLEYSLTIPSSDPGRKPKVELKTRFQGERPKPKTYNPDRLVYVDDIEITPAEVRAFYESLREPPKKEVAFSHGIARVPSTLLSFCNELNSISGTNIGGKNLGMRSVSYEDLRTGKAKVEVYEAERKGRGDRIKYTFLGVLSQDGRPCLESTVDTMVNGELDIRALQSRYLQSRTAA